MSTAASGATQAQQRPEPAEPRRWIWVEPVDLSTVARRIPAPALAATGPPASTQLGCAAVEAQLGLECLACLGRPRSAVTAKRPERNVVRIVSEGLADKDIATRLFVSPRTVQTHLTHVYTKLGADLARATRSGSSPARLTDADIQIEDVVVQASCRPWLRSRSVARPEGRNTARFE